LENPDVIVRVPGDKSISQRALLLAALAEGESRLRGLLPSADPRSTASALRDLGVGIPDLPIDGSEIRIRGRGLRGLSAPEGALDLGNSGTGTRLLLGVLAGQPFSSVVDGDASLRGRPMGRVTRPLGAMGARFEWLGEPDRLPLRVEGGRLEGREFDLPVASAQVKSAILLAGVVAGVPVGLTEPGASRDHTERMLRGCGVSVLTHVHGPGRRVELRDPPTALMPLDLDVPGDLSSAAFVLLACALGVTPGVVTIEGVGLNPTRDGVLGLFRRMGLGVEETNEGEAGGEPMGRLRVTPGELHGIGVDAADVTAAIDEIPAISVAAVRARGWTRIRGARELRVKETDRIHALVVNLRALGVEVVEVDDGLDVLGTGAPLAGRVDAFDDHRIAMAFGVLGAEPGNRIEVVGRESVDVSFPGFWPLLERLRGGRAPIQASGQATVVTIDGPAGAGKSTTAREVARRLGYRYLDSGALYRALTYALLTADVPPELWPGLDARRLDDLGVGVVPGDGTLVLSFRGRELGPELRTDAVNARVSSLARLPAVRKWLLRHQRALGAHGRLVTDGRDMGTVVFPEAGTKVFLEADLAERARRRLLEQGVQAPNEVAIRAEAERLAGRDRIDRSREASPLRPAAGAVVLDTTTLDFEAQVQSVVALARQIDPRADPPLDTTTEPGTR
jgi:3-phosphoshikimate 1-carboxyvinyltransferase